MKKVVGIVTVGRGLLLSNYGSFFQHYALRQVLRKMGYSPFRVDNDSLWNELWELLIPFRRLWTIARNAIMGRELPDRVSFLSSVQRIIFAHQYKRLIAPIFEKQVDAELYIAGGDCVWFNTMSGLFLLDKPASARKISYAVSSSWEFMRNQESWRELIQRVGTSYSAISAREAEGCKIIREITGREVERVLDPVLLLDKTDYLKIAANKKIIKRPTLLYYAVNITSAEDMGLARICKWADKINADTRVVGIQGAEDFSHSAMFLRPTPSEFLTLFQQAKCIVTNSFHGIVFSIVFDKPFVFVSQKSKRWGDQNHRQNELLEMLAQEQRRVDDDEILNNVVELLTTPLPDDLRPKIEFLRMKSTDWLMKALSKGGAI